MKVGEVVYTIKSQRPFDYFSDFLRASIVMVLESSGIKANLLRGLFDTFFVLKYTKASCILSDQET